jgi:hypothetical protein
MRYISRRGHHEQLLRQRMQSQRGRADLRALGKLQLDQLKQLPARTRHQVAQQLLNSPDPITRLKAEHRRDTWLLRGMGGRWRSGS